MQYDNIYFIGIGGIGMSALARYFAHEGCRVAGYDRTSTPLTEQLEAEGIKVHYEDSISLVDSEFLDPAKTLVVYTPAIPKDHAEYNYFVSHGFEVMKRSEILKVVSAAKDVMAVAGTHGKTTTTTMLAWFNTAAAGEGSAFLGGISKNFDSNLVLGGGDRLAVEADEFDRSFLRLTPDVAVVTSMDPDHLDIYENFEAIKDAFEQFVSQIREGGAVVIKKGVEIAVRNPGIRVFSYAYNTEADFYARNITDDGQFDIVLPDGIIAGCRLGIPGWVNIENCIAAVSLLWLKGFDRGKLRQAIADFSGVKRRFDVHINTPKIVYIDDYAHHPAELSASITSLRRHFAGRHITGIFQPHLYTRTRDFHTEFAESLSLLDDVLLMPIYPARELPIEGVSSEMILCDIKCPKQMVTKEALLATLAANPALDVVVTYGAGDIDQFCKPIENLLKTRI